MDVIMCSFDRKLLKVVLKKKEINIKDADDIYGAGTLAALIDLWKRGYLENIISGYGLSESHEQIPHYSGIYKLKGSGKAYLENYKKEIALKWIPIIVSILAFFRPELTKLISLIWP